MIYQWKEAFGTNNCGIWIKIRQKIAYKEQHLKYHLQIGSHIVQAAMSYFCFFLILGRGYSAPAEVEQYHRSLYEIWVEKRLTKYTLRNVQKIDVLLWILNWFNSYPLGLLHWHWGNHTIAPVPVKQPWRIWVNESHETNKHWYGDSYKATQHKTMCIFYGGYCKMSPSWVSYGCPHGWAMGCLSCISYRKLT